MYRHLAMLVKLAWRNLWRQKRRTLITASALAVALSLSMFTLSMLEGVFAHNIDNGARLSSGLAQIQHPEFADSQSINHLLPGSAEFIAPAHETAGISHLLPRLESYALAAGDEKSKGALVIGVEPSAEHGYSKLGDKISAGDYLADSDTDAVLIGAGLADHLGLSVGDELVLYGQGYQGQVAAALYTIKGILTFPMPGMDNQLVYLPLAAAQDLFSTEGQITSWIVHTDSLSALPPAVDSLRARFSQHSVLSWDELTPEMAQQFTMKMSSTQYMMYLLYGVVGFGLFATLVMMVLERQREFGVMLATGMTRARLLLLLMIESLFIAGLGMAIALAISLPLLAWMSANPISFSGERAQMMLDMGWDAVMPVLFEADIILGQLGVVFKLLLLCLIYPLWRATRLDVVSALKGGSHAG